jgi:hypothetical protein
MKLERFLKQIERDESDEAQAILGPHRRNAVRLLFAMYCLAWAAFFFVVLLRLGFWSACGGLFLIIPLTPASLVVAGMVAPSAHDYLKSGLVAAGLWFLAIPATLLILLFIVVAIAIVTGTGGEVEGYGIILLLPVIAAFVALASVVLGIATGCTLALPWPFLQRPRPASDSRP